MIFMGYNRCPFKSEAVKVRRCLCWYSQKVIPYIPSCWVVFPVIAGMLIGHSVLLEGPAFECVSPTVFNFLVAGDSSICFPTKADIPLNLTT